MIKVAIMFGGPGKEHEVSLSSAKNILENIDRNLFDVLEVLVTQDKKYEIDGKFFNEDDGIEEIKEKGVEIVFPVIHGTYGEDGELQEKLEQDGIRFVGSSGKVSAVTIDKNKTNKILEENGIRIPRSTIITKEDCGFNFTYPIIIKPIDEGSSVDLYKFENEIDFKNHAEVIFKNHKQMLVQEFVKGKEFTCGVIEKDNEVIPLIATEVILTKGELFDYEAKYTTGGCREVTPAEIDDTVMKKIQDVAVMCHKVLGCTSISRTDMIIKDDVLYVLEINTVPGMTKTSFIPQQARVCGYEMKDLITLLIKSTKSRNNVFIESKDE
jgi:D-alanine-D-alanine ligase